MPEPKPRKFAEALMERTARGLIEERRDEDDENATTRERQGNSEAFSLEVKFKDGRRKQTFPWNLYGGHEWTDEEGMECLTVLFGMRVLVIRGYNFESLHKDLTLGKVTSIREHNTRQVQLLTNENAENIPVVVEIEAFPNYRKIISDIKGEEEHDTGRTGKITR